MLAAAPLIFALLTADAGLPASADGGAVNAPLPPPKDKTTAPRDVDPAGNPRAQDQSALPNSLSDIPFAPVGPPPASTTDKSKPPAGGGAERGGEIRK